MDELILKSKFDGNSDLEIKDFYPQIDSLNVEVDEDYIIRIIDALSEQVPKYNPKWNFQDCSMLTRCFTKLNEMIEIKVSEKIINKIINFIKLIIQLGWTATNCNLIDVLSKNFSESYYENITEQQLLEQMSIFDIMDFKISDHELPDNHDIVRRKQNSVVMTLLVNYWKSTTIQQNKEIFRTFLKKLYFKSWEKNEDVEIYSNMLYKLSRSLENIFSTDFESLVKLFSQISEKIINEKVSTIKGREMLCQFFSSKYLVLNKDTVDLIMFKWVEAFLDLSKLNEDWMEPILDKLSRDILYIDRKIQSKAFKTCENEDLIKKANEYLLMAIENFPIKSDDEDRKHSNRVSEWSRSVKAIATVFLKFTMKTAEHFDLFIPCLAKLIIVNNGEAKDIFVESFKNIEKPVQAYFKNKPEQLISLIDHCAEASFKGAETEDSSIPYPFNLPIFTYDDYYEPITKIGKLSKAFSLDIVQESMRKHFIRASSQFSMTILIFLRAFCPYLEFKKYSTESMLEFVKAMNAIFGNDLLAVFNPHANCFGELMKNISEQITQYPEKYASSITEMANTCRICLNMGMEREMDGGETMFSSHSLILFHVLQQFATTKPQVTYIVEFCSFLYEAINMTDESHGFHSGFVTFVSMLPRKCPKPEILVGTIPNCLNLVDKLIGTSMEGSIYMLLDGVHWMIIPNPVAALDHLARLEGYLSVLQTSTHITPVIEILNIVYSEYPDRINEDVIPILTIKFKEDSNIVYQVGTLFVTISKTKSHLLRPLLNDFLESIERFKLICLTSFVGIVANILEHDPTFGETIFPIVVSLVDKNIEDSPFCITLLTGLRRLGLLRHDLLVNMKGNIETWQQSNNAYHDMCQHLLDIIADRSLASLDSNINEQKKIISNIDDKIENQKDQVENITKEVKEQKETIDDVTKRVENAEVKMDELGNQIDEIDNQVQEIDLKTLSHAPKWAREVSKLLNPESNEDWRLLASRLGYSTDDIRSWSTHPDPCMSLLSDWFAVRRKVEATRAVLEQLIEINRKDAATIVENALIAAESYITDDDPAEFITPPLIFLSYQWAIQEEVKILREHLQKAGYRCWMDIGQMGGGDKLYEAIDRGIRGAVVFISCVTKKYSESPNCKRELNLAISLKKSVIPLQMERMEWPPVGTMGPLLTEYIFIRMFGKPGIESVSGAFWPKDRFQELLMQIRYSCAPEYEIIDESYSNWWEPPETKFISKTNTNKPVTGDIIKLPENNNQVKEGPEIFISYQWGKQEEVKKLYNYLTSLKYSCWMDIYQMGGGDSLYDKIDKGLRNCVLMISCVTPKYADSPNCRREVSLCDSLKKPIIPIMLDRMNWPPEGPMSMVFTQMLYISFLDNFEEQHTWNGKATQELLNKINQIIPKLLQNSAEESFATKLPISNSKTCVIL